LRAASKDHLYLHNSFGCSGCSSSFVTKAKAELAEDYEINNFSWADSTINITKKKGEGLLNEEDVATINNWFKSQPQYADYRVYRTSSDLRQDQQRLQQQQWFDLCLSVFGFIVISLLNLLAFYLKSILLQQLLGVACGIVCTAVIFYLGYDLLPRLFVNSWAAIEACISKPQDSTVRPSILYEYLLVFIVASILLQALVSMSYGLFIGHMLCMNHFHCPLMIAMSFYAKQWLRTKIDSNMTSLNYSKSNQQDLVEGKKAKIVNGDRIFFVGKLSSKSAVFDTGYTTGDSELKTINENDTVEYGWIYRGKKSITVKVEKAGDNLDKIHSSIHDAETERSIKRAELFNIEGWSAFLPLVFLLVIAVVTPIAWHIFASGFGIAASFDMAFSIILIACPCRDFVKNFCYYLALRDLPSSIHLKGSGVYEILDNMTNSPLRIGFDWTNTLQRDNGKRWSIYKLRDEAQQVLSNLRNYANSIGVYSGTEKISESDIAGYKQQLKLKQFFVKQSSKSKKEQVKQDGVNLYIGDNHNDILAGLAADVFIAINNKDALHYVYNPMRYADIVLDDTLEPLPELLQAIAIAKKAAYAVGIINTIYNICALFLACGGYLYLFGAFLNPVTASFIMLGSMLLNFLSSIAFTAVFTKLAYSNVSSICEIGERLGLLEEKRVVEDALGYVHKDRLHTEIAEFSVKAAGRYPCGYGIFTIGGYVVTTRGVLLQQEYTARYRLGAIAHKWQKIVLQPEVDATTSNSLFASAKEAKPCSPVAKPCSPVAKPGLARDLLNICENIFFI
jgi:cation transport ATPase